MKFFAASVCVLLLANSLAHGQNLFLDFNGKDTFTPAFDQNSEGITLAWSATGGVSDVSNAAGGGVVSSGSGQVTAEHKGAPMFSLDDTLSYTYSVDVQLNSLGDVGASIVSLTLGEKGLLSSTGHGLTATVENLDGTHFGVIITRHDPADVTIPAVQNGNLPSLHHWIQVSFIVQETDVTTGAFQCTVRIRDLGTAGTSTAGNIGTSSTTFLDASLAGKTAANWLPLWGTSVGGNNFDNFAVGISDFGRGRLVVVKGDAAPGIANAAFSVLGNPTIAGNAIAFQARVVGTTKDSGINSSNNSGIWSYPSAESGTLIAQTGKTSASAPGTSGAAFAKLSDPVASMNALGFYATLIPGTGDATSKNDAGVWTQDGSSLSLYARKGDPAPGLTGATIAAISQFGLDQNGAAPILGTASGHGLSSSNNLCAWLPDSNGALQLAYQKNETFDGLKVTFQAYTPQKLVIGQTRSVDPVDGHGCAILRDKEGEALALATPKGIASPGASGFTEVSALRTGTTAPGSSGSGAPTIKTFGLPAVDAAGTLAFSYTLTGGGVKSSDNFGLALLPKGGAAELLAVTG
ncbi:MAG TPA: choice-of-anchor tandem repeat NxxGxxAF-containing protein, partial [Chthoniobacteraceae bacterium]